jgi:hypothetical protein
VISVCLPRRARNFSKGSNIGPPAASNTISARRPRARRNREARRQQEEVAESCGGWRSELKLVSIDSHDPGAAACSRDSVLGLRRRLAIKSQFSWRAPPYRAGGNKVNNADRRVSSMKGADAGLGRFIGNCDPLVLTQVL